MEAVDGIAEWWIARSQIRVRVEAVRRVLKELTDSGVLKERLCINFCMSSRHNLRLVHCRERLLLCPPISSNGSPAGSNMKCVQDSFINGKCPPFLG